MRGERGQVRKAGMARRVPRTLGYRSHFPSRATKI
jgi:hypothetical protein